MAVRTDRDDRTTPKGNVFFTAFVLPVDSSLIVLGCFGMASNARNFPTMPDSQHAPCAGSGALRGVARRKAVESKLGTLPDLTTIGGCLVVGYVGLTSLFQRYPHALQRF